MPNLEPTEQIIEDITKAVKTQADVSSWKNNRKTSPLLSIISNLSNTPKAAAPLFDFARVKNQILDRIAVPEIKQSGWFMSLPFAFRTGVAVLGTFLIVLSLTLGLAVNALNSVPGQASYPLKKVVKCPAPVGA